jgi:hypothetical protein
MANKLATVGMSNQQMIDVLVCDWREHKGPNTRLRSVNWFVKYAIQPARAWARTEQERDHRRAEREARQRVEAEDSKAVAAAQTKDAELARKALSGLFQFEIQRLVQLGNDTEPSFRLELVDGRAVEVPTLAAMNSFTGLDRFVWRYLGTPLPPQAKKQWRLARTLLGRIKVVQETGGETAELMLADLAEYFQAADARLFVKFPAAEFPQGAPESTASFDIHDGRGTILARTEEEYVAALHLLALPQNDKRSVCAVRWDDEETTTVIFRPAPLYTFLTKLGRKFEPAEMSRRLIAAGFLCRQSASDHGVWPIKRVWVGELRDGIGESHPSGLGVAARDYDLATERVQ